MKHFFKYDTALRILSVILTVLFLNACTTSPTGRTQVLLYPESELATMGQQAFLGMKESTKVSQKTIENKLVQCITKELLLHVDKSVFSGEWEAVVFDDAQVNAFALPGGKIGVYAGLLNVAQTPSQLAAVIGHEIGHVIAQHGNERMSNTTLINIGQQSVGQILANNQVSQTPLIMQALGIGLQFGALKYSREHESEADEIGLELMARAGFEPSESVALWENMAALSEGKEQAEFISTHPSHSTRISDLNKKMQRAKSIYIEAKRRPNCG